MAICSYDGKLPPAYYDRAKRSKVAKPVKPQNPWSNAILWDKLVVYPPQRKTSASFPVKIGKDLPEFTFKLSGEFRNIMEFYPSSVEIADATTQKRIQTLSGKNRFDDRVCGGHDINALFSTDLIQLVDLNHDGYLDFRILCGAGATGLNVYATYLYKPALKQFRYHKTLSQLYTVTLDADSKSLATYYRQGSCYECRGYFTITKDDTLILKKVEWSEEGRDQLDNFVCYKVTGAPYEKVKMYLNKSSLCDDLMVSKYYPSRFYKATKVIGKERLYGSLDGQERGVLGTPMSKEGE